MPDLMNRFHSSHFRLFTLVLIAAFLLLCYACARIGSPDGGPYDDTPPRVVHTSPKFGSANEKNVKTITIEFDEMVTIENANEKVVISPPQIEQPEIDANGRRITVKLLDSLKANTTYTIDFADAIVDNNEGNPYGDYAFTFSTGESVDTFQVSGHVLNASDLEPIKGILVGLYKVENITSDSIFYQKPFERISRTDSRGHFVIKGLAYGEYRAFALQDLNRNFIYDQKAEKVAFSKRILTTSSAPDVRTDTIWHDSIHYDSIRYIPYIHYFPDDVVLTAFESSLQDRHLLKSERPVLHKFTLVFTAPSDTLPRLTGLNFNSQDAFVVDVNERKDTLDYWIKDSLIYNLDTLQIQLDFFETDTAGRLSITTDTLRLVSKMSKERMAREAKGRYEEWVKEYRQRVRTERRAAEAKAKEEARNNPAIKEEKEESSSSEDRRRRRRSKEEDEDIVIPPMPEEFLDIRLSNNIQAMNPDQNVDFTFEEPLETVDLSKIRFGTRRDSIFTPANFIFRQVPGRVKTYRLYAEWEADSSYQVEIDTAAFVNIYGKRNESMKRQIRMKRLDSYSTLFVRLGGQPLSETGEPTGNWDDAIVQLLNASDKPVKTIKAQGGKADFYFISPGTYFLRLFRDLNGNGVWDTGDYDLQLQPEPVYYYPDALTLKARWEITQDWNPVSLALPKQKPLKITKQKPDRAKSVRNKNADRLKRKGQ